MRRRREEEGRAGCQRTFSTACSLLGQGTEGRPMSVWGRTFFRRSYTRRKGFGPGLRRSERRRRRAEEPLVFFFSASPSPRAPLANRTLGWVAASRRLALLFIVRPPFAPPGLSNARLRAGSSSCPAPSSVRLLSGPRRHDLPSCLLLTGFGIVLQGFVSTVRLRLKSIVFRQPQAKVRASEGEELPRARVQRASERASSAPFEVRSLSQL